MINPLILNKQVKNINMMDLRRNIGSIIDEVIYTGKEIIINKHGKPVCILTVIPDNNQNNIISTASRQRNIEKLYGAIPMSNQETKQWLNQGEEAEQKYDKKINNSWKNY